MATVRKILFTAEDILSNLQASVIGGLTELRRNMDRMYTLIMNEVKFAGKARVIRVYCHMALWLRYSYFDAAGVPAALSLCVSNEVYCALLEAYIDHLTAQKQQSFLR